MKTLKIEKNNKVKPTELRIGNLVNYKYGEDEYNTITAIDEERNVGIDTITGFGVDIEDIEPIVITEDILNKFGFVEAIQRRGKGNVVWEFMKKGIWVVRNTNGIIYIYWRMGVIDAVTPNDFTAHKLQNLYFSLTGEELEVTE